MVPEEQLPAILIVAMALLGATASMVAVLLGHLAVARGIVAGAGLAVLYLAILWRFVLAFLARAGGRRIGLGDMIILQGGLPGRLLLAGAVLFWVAQHQPWINLWAAIGGFLSYRVLLAAHQLLAIIAGRKEPLAPALGWDSQDDITTRGRSTIGRTRRWHQGW